jgi:hypothetical protein
VKVRQNRSTPAATGRIAMALATAALVSLVFSAPAPAHAITRDEVIARATSWVNLRLGYSRRATFGGYRRDCSGMVSMAWGVGRSYTSRSISSRAMRIPVGALQPGDAIQTPGHVEIFGGWVNQRKGTFVALEQSGRGRGAVRRVKRLARRSVALRYRGITEPVAVAAVVIAPPAATPAVTAAAIAQP